MLIPSKLSRPVRLEHTVVRERLLAKLSGANNYRLVLVTSPAGYGKQRSFLNGPRVKRSWLVFAG
jgi:LuxR family maltose regulon positive regulatory protein